MSEFNVKNLTWILIFLLILFSLAGFVVYFHSNDKSSIFTQISNHDLKE